MRKIHGTPVDDGTTAAITNCLAANFGTESR
jgi:hypothetical protein